MALTEVDKKFLIRLKNEGYSKEEAVAELKKVKLKVQSPTVSAVLPTISRAAGEVEAQKAIADQAAVAGRSTGIERPEGAVKAGVKKEVTPEEDQGIVERFKIGAGEGAQSAYQTEQLRQSGNEQLKDEGLDVPEGSVIPGGVDLQSFINVGLPLVRGAVNVLEPAFDKVMEMPIPTTVGSFTPKQVVEAGSEAIPEEAKQEIADKINAMTEWYEQQPDAVKGALRTGGALGEIALGFLGGLEAKQLTKQGVKTLTPALSEFKTGIGNQISVTTGKAKQFLDTKAVDMLNSNIKIDPVKGAKQFYDLSGGQTHGEFLLERGIVGTPEETVKQLTERFNTVKNNLDSGIASIGGTYKPQSAKKVIDELVARFEKTESPDLAKFKKMQAKFESEGLTTQEILDAKRVYEQKVKTGYLKEQNSVQVEKATNLDNAIREDLVRIAEDSGFENFRDMSKEIQLTKSLLNSVTSKQIKQIINNQFSLTDNMLMIAGAIEPSSLAVLGIKKIGGTPSIQAKIINAIASGDIKSIKGIPAVPDEIIQIKNAEKRSQAFADWLDREGFTAIEQETGMKLLPEPSSIQVPGVSSEDLIDVRGQNLREGTGVFDKGSPSAGFKTGAPPKTTSKVSPELKPLYEEAKKYKSAEEFYKKYIGSSTQYGEYSPELRLGGTEGGVKITDLGIDPDKTITIYRGIDDTTGKIKKSINDGDFVTTDYDSALAYASGKENVVSKKVKAKDLILEDEADFFKEEPFFTGAEYIYTTKYDAPKPLTKSQLTDIWKEANQKQ